MAKPGRSQQKRVGGARVPDPPRYWFTQSDQEKETTFAAVVQPRIGWRQSLPTSTPTGGRS